MRNKTQILLENGIYVLIWAIIFVIPLLGYSTDDGIRWTEVKRFWRNVLPFLLLFAVNNYLLIPLLLRPKRYGWYAAAVIAAVALLFVAVPMAEGRFSKYPQFGRRYGGSRTESEYRRPGRPSWRDSLPPDSLSPDSLRRFAAPGERPPWPLSPPDSDRSRYRRPMPIKWGAVLNDLMLAFLLIGFNVAIYLLFKSMADSRRLKELESQKLKAELDYLKAQVNPHFFMNTLNNIHALVDVDAEKAKETVIELSKIMRYVLYDADRSLIPLQKEIEFLNNYIALMRIRYSDELDISARYPEGAEAVSIPPLLLVTLIENAFKHGIRHGAPSYIRTELSLEDGRLTYTVRNTPGDAASDPGMGLDNLRKRLRLLFGNDYTLTGGISGDEYVAVIIIPVSV